MATRFIKDGVILAVWTPETQTLRVSPLPDAEDDAARLATWAALSGDAVWVALCCADDPPAALASLPDAQGWASEAGGAPESWTPPPPPPP